MAIPKYRRRPKGASNIAAGKLAKASVAFYGGLLLFSLRGAATPTAGVSAMLNPNEILSRMEERYQRQLQALESYRDRRRYSVVHPLLGDSTYLVVEENFVAPEQKRFQILERGGSSQVQERVFSKLLEVEQETARASVRPGVDLCRRNYAFAFQKYDPAAGAYVFQVTPRSSNPYLLRGNIWINAADFAVQRIEGEPARKQSALIRSTRFVHEFAKFGEYWFPVRHRSETTLALFGRAVLSIDYFDYRWKSR